MEGSYRTNDTQTEHSMLCITDDTGTNVPRNFKDGLLCIHTLNPKLWDNFGGNQPYSDKIFKIQKRAIRIITKSRMRDSCRDLFKKLEILPLYSQYIYSISIFVTIYFVRTIRSTVSTERLNPTCIHQQLTQQSIKRECTTWQ